MLKFPRYILTGFKVVATTLFVSWLYVYIKGNVDSFSVIVQNISFWPSICIVSCYISTLFVQARMLFQADSVVFSSKSHFYSDAIAVNCSSTLVGFFFPSGALVSKVFLLNKVFLIEKKKAALIIGKVVNIQVVTTVVLAGAVAVIYTLFRNASFGHNNFIEGLIFISAVFVVLSIMIYAYLKFSRLAGPAYLSGFLNGVLPKDVWQGSSVAVLHALQQGLFAIILFAYLSSLEVDVKLMDCLAIVLISASALLISLTPGNLGFKEGVYYTVSVALGFEVEVIVAILLVDRVVQFIFFFLAWLMSGFVEWPTKKIT